MRLGKDSSTFRRTLIPNVRNLTIDTSNIELDDVENTNENENCRVSQDVSKILDSKNFDS